MIEWVDHGDLLIAPPGMLDPRFKDTVILISHAGEQGHMGLCLNRALPHSLSRVIADRDITIDRDPVLFWGGPVRPETVWMLHDSGWSDQYTHHIDANWSLTSNPDMFQRLSQGDWPTRYRWFMGFSAWAPDQLISEIEGEEPWPQSSSWLVWREPDSQQILDVDHDLLWSVCAEQTAKQAVSSWLS